MDKLWAPWRSSYIKNIHKEKRCLFCRVFKSKDDAKNLVCFRSKHSLALLNLYPYNNGHLMVAPRKHKNSLEFLNAFELNDLMLCVLKMKKILDKTLRPDGFNIGINIGRAGGAGIDKHLHVHIVPRWVGDHNFMPTLAQTKVMSQSLDALYSELKKALK